jgi:CRISPR-associated protein Cmr3
MTPDDWTSFRLEPDDVLFFRDGKPSTRGTDHYLRSLFPPYPSTLYGAVRTRRLLDGGVDLAGLDETSWGRRLNGLSAELGPWGGFGSLRLRGPWLLRGDEPLLPVPADLGVIPAKATQDAAPRIETVVRYRPSSESLPGGGSHPEGLRLLLPHGTDGDPWKPPAPGVEPRPATGWLLVPAGLAVWRSGGLPAPDHFVHASTLWHDETRTGLGLRPKLRISEDGQLYTFGFVRLLPGVSLGFEVAGSGLKPEGRLRLGGEGRSVLLAPGPTFPSYSDVKVPPLPWERGFGGEGPGEAGSPGLRPLLTLTFATPALSATGAWPPGFSEAQLQRRIGDVPVRLVGAAVPGSVLVGGWDLARNQAKPLRRALPAGSVFLFEPLDGIAAAEAANQLDGMCLSDFSGNEGLAQQGFGLVAAGVSW